MNKIRRTWKNNGTPFYFRFVYDDNTYIFSSETCKKLDSIEFDFISHLSCMDVLVDILFIKKSSKRVSLNILYNSILSELNTLVKLVVAVSGLVNVGDNVYELPNSEK